MSGPPASSTAAKKRMQANRRRDTKPERLLRSILHTRGRRYRIDYPIRTAHGVRPIRPDIVFTQARLVVFIDGCFWHSCPQHSSQPKANSSYWEAKLDENIRRDQRNTEALESAEWRVLRIWTHTAPDDAADLVDGALKDAQKRMGTRHKDAPS